MKKRWVVNTSTLTAKWAKLANKFRSISHLYYAILFQNAYEKLIDKFWDTNIHEMDLWPQYKNIE